MITCTKRMGPFPFAHRQPTHQGHCAFVHGHNWYFDLTFLARSMDRNGFVLDFGGPEMKEIKHLLGVWFDHTLVLAKTDPRRLLFEKLEVEGLACIKWVDNTSCEALAAFVLEELNERLDPLTNSRVAIVKIVLWEDDKNSATVEVI